MELLFFYCFIIILPFTLNIYTEFRKMRQGTGAHASENKAYEKDHL